MEFRRDNALVSQGFEEFLKLKGADIASAPFHLLCVACVALEGQPGCRPLPVSPQPWSGGKKAGKGRDCKEYPKLHQTCNFVQNLVMIAAPGILVDSWCPLSDGLNGGKWRAPVLYRFHFASKTCNIHCSEGESPYINPILYFCRSRVEPQAEVRRKNRNGDDKE